MDALSPTPLVTRLSDLMPKTVKDAPCQEIEAGRRTLDELPVPATWPTTVPVHHAAARDHARTDWDATSACIA
jgi:hypothetical protein